MKSGGLCWCLRSHSPAFWGFLSKLSVNRVGKIHTMHTAGFPPPRRCLLLRLYEFFHISAVLKCQNFLNPWGSWGFLPSGGGGTEPRTQGAGGIPLSGRLDRDSGAGSSPPSPREVEESWTSH